MHGDSIGKRDHPQVAATQFRHQTPESVSPVRLALDPDGMPQHTCTPLFPEIGAFSQDIILEVIGKSAGSHPAELCGWQVPGSRRVSDDYAE
jgi:hypothetical protein